MADDREPLVLPPDEFELVKALEHAMSAAAGSHEGIRLWMQDCGELVAKHRARAEAAEAKLAEIDQMMRTFFIVRTAGCKASRDLAEGIRQILDRKAAP